jgi:hypothetical protein
MEARAAVTLGTYRSVEGVPLNPRDSARAPAPSVSGTGIDAPGPLGRDDSGAQRFLDAAMLCEDFLADDLGGRALLDRLVEEGRAAAEDLASREHAGRRSLRFSFESSELAVDGVRLPGPSPRWADRLRMGSVRLSGDVEGEQAGAERAFTMQLRADLSGEYGAEPEWSPLSARIEREVTWKSSGGVTVPFSVKVRRLGLAAVAALVVIVAAVWWPRHESPLYSPMSASGVYALEQQNGFIPTFVCENDAQFAAVTAEKLGVALIPKAGSTLALIGWTYRPVVSEHSMVLMARVDGTPVLVVMDRLMNDHEPEVGDNAVHLFRREVGEAVMYEITPLPESRVLDALQPAG